MSTHNNQHNAKNSLSRRAFLGRLGLLAASGASGALIAACQTSSSSGDSTTSASPQGGGSARSSDGTILVAYYSAQGHTKAVAETIANTVGATLFTIEPENPFTEDDLNWRDNTSRVVTEYENPDQRTTRLATNTPADFAQYETVFIGYPLWWQRASWAMTDFARQNDFSGKTVIPFCTSQASPLGESGTELAELAGGTGTWQEGIRFTQNVSTEEVAQWADQFRP